MKRLYTHILLLASLMLGTSCSDWLDLQPEGEATSGQLYSTGAGYRTVLNGLYRNMGKADLYGCQLQFGLVDCMSQQYDLTTDQTTEQAYIKAGEFAYNDYTVVAVTDRIWSSAYNVIATANDLLQNIEYASPDLFEYGEMERDLIRGEAYACRALLHFDLLRLFAPAPGKHDDGQAYVPYVTDYPNISARRIPVKEFLEKVIGDLEEARRLTKTFDTSEEGVAANATLTNRYAKSVAFGNGEQLPQFLAGRGHRLSYHAITALLARVCQYAGGAEREEQAYNYAKEVIDLKDGSTPYYTDDFTGITTSSTGQDNQSSIAQFDTKDDLKAKASLIFSAYNNNSYEENRLEYFFKRPENNGGMANVCYLPVRHATLFGDEVNTDIRATQWLFTPDGVNYLSGKWYLNPTETVRDANVNILPVIRLTEMVYIAAEYEARHNHLTDAYERLNKIRETRKLGQLPEKGTWEDFQADLIKDARREWISEGQLFYLYKRLNAEVPIKTKKFEDTRPLSKGESFIPAPTNQVN